MFLFEYSWYWLIDCLVRLAVSTPSWLRPTVVNGNECCRTNTSRDDALKIWWNNLLGNTLTWSKRLNNRLELLRAEHPAPAAPWRHIQFTRKKMRRTNSSTPKRMKSKPTTLCKCQLVTGGRRQGSAQIHRFLSLELFYQFCHYVNICLFEILV